MKWIFILLALLNLILSFILHSVPFIFIISITKREREIILALLELKNTRCLILDIRGNRGGLTGNVSQISGRFCLQNKTYAISRTKNGSGQFDFGPGVELEIKRKGNIVYENPVILLTNAQTMSAGEEFAMAMKSQPQVTQVGNIPEGKGIIPDSENLIVNTSLNQDLQMIRAIELCR